MLQVRDGSRILQFEGKLIGSSTSWRRGSQRWIEFKLYKTVESNKYILSRIGVSLLYHSPDCEVARRNKLQEQPIVSIDQSAEPCDQCHPDNTGLPIACPEKPRYWAQVCETPDGVFDSLVKYDTNGNKYLTFVAQRLLEEAAQEDQKLSDAYYVEVVK